MCIRLYERHKEYERHIEHEKHVIEFQEIWGRKVIKWKRTKRENGDKILKIQIEKILCENWRNENIF